MEELFVAVCNICSAKVKLEEIATHMEASHRNKKRIEKLWHKERGFIWEADCGCRYYIVRGFIEPIRRCDNCLNFEKALENQKRRI